MKNWPLHSFLRKGPDRFILKQVLFIKNTYYEAIFDLQPTKKNLWYRVFRIWYRKLRFIEYRPAQWIWNELKFFTGAVLVTRHPNMSKVYVRVFGDVDPSLMVIDDTVMQVFER